MNRQKGGREHSDDDDGRKVPFEKLPVCPLDEFFHESGSFKSGCRFENNADDMSRVIERRHAVLDVFIAASMSLVLVAEAKQQAVHLFDDVFGERHFLP